MKLSKKQEKKLTGLAEAILFALEDISRQAAEKDRGDSEGLTGADHRVVQRLSQVKYEIAEALRWLQREPAMARVDVLLGEHEVPAAYYVCRTSAAGVHAPDGKLASYRAPIGRIAEYEPGEFFEIPAGRNKLIEGQVVDRIRFSPEAQDNVWDARDDRIELGKKRFSLGSLRALLEELRPKEDKGFDIFAELAAARADSTITDGFVSSTLEAIALRDQAILDRFQGKIFRLPIDQRVLLLGPPGTGKTTTLIKRIAQKRTLDVLPEEERELVQDLGGDVSWRMFAPTELLTEYLRDAFIKEDVPAQRDELTTWVRQRNELARDVFKILQSASNPGMRLTHSVEVLRHTSSRSLRELYERFEAFADEALLNGVKARLARTLSMKSPIVDKDRRVLERLAANLDMTKLLGFANQDANLLKTRASAFEELASLSEQTLYRGVDRDTMTSLLKALEPFVLDDQDDDPLDVDEEDEALPEEAATPRSLALKLVRRIVNRKASALASGRAMPRSAAWRESAKLVLPHFDKDKLTTYGIERELARTYRALSSAPLDTVRRLRTLYARFRRQGLKNGEFYVGAGNGKRVPEYVKQRLVTGAEVDVLLLLSLKNLRRLRNAAPKQRFFERLDEHVVAQIYVDEVTDFSAVQIASMLYLSQPKLRSFFACGDFRQRITHHGINERADLEWIRAHHGVSLDEPKIFRRYRQSRRLGELASTLAELQGHPDETEVMREAPSEKDPSPLLLEGRNLVAQAPWIADRIVEIEKKLGVRPSIAILVDGEARVQPTTEALRPHLDERTIGIAACHEGRVVGDPRDVRVFDLQHIKGLEFEAVFMLDVDALAERLPSLFDRYIYVATTRAATFLALTARTKLPEALEPIRGLLSVEGW